jgi:type IV pilus assembly protein PilC
VQADDDADVLAVLRTRALYVTAIDRETGLRRTVTQSIRSGTPHRRALFAFFRSFSTLVRAGVPLLRALEVVIARTTDARLREALAAIAADVEHGVSLSDAVARRPRTFPPLYSAMIRAGELGGILDDVLERVATFLEREAEIRQKLRSALAYPLVVVGATFILITFLLVRVVPMFGQMFAAFHADPPLATKSLLALSALLQNGTTWGALIAIAAAAMLGLFAAMHGHRTSRGLDHARLHVPFVGSLLRKAIMARIARTLGALLRSGVELLAAVDAVGRVAGSVLYEDALARVNRGLRDGETLSAPIAECGLFDPLAVALLHVGEETGCVDEMLLKIASYFENDVEAAIATLAAVLEPALIGVLGVVVGFIVFSIFIPLYSLIGAVGQ